jgi:hypothetical protein
MIYILIVGALLLCSPSETHAHALAGNRFFPATLVVEDPGVTDELDFEYNYIGESDEISRSVEMCYTKTITCDFGIELKEIYFVQKPFGFDNLSVGLKYQFYKNAEHEAILSVGVDADIGGTGNRHFAESFTTFSPTFYFGKGLNFFPDRMKYFRPLAITGTVGMSFPTKNENEKTLNLGFTIQYDINYLKCNVENLRIPIPCNHFIPIIEFPLEVDLSGKEKGQFTGYVNPGIIWVDGGFQLGLEAQIPINKSTAKDIGFIFQIHFYFESLFPNSIGKPFFD